MPGSYDFLRIYNASSSIYIEITGRGSDPEVTVWPYVSDVHKSEDLYIPDGGYLSFDTDHSGSSSHSDSGFEIVLAYQPALAFDNSSRCVAR